MTTEQALIFARRYVEEMTGMSTIGSYPIPFSMEGKIVIGVTCEEFKYMVIITPDIDSVRLFEILEHSSLAETQWTINKKLKK